MESNEAQRTAFYREMKKKYNWDSNYYEIKDEMYPLYLCHYTENALTENLYTKELKGEVVDMETFEIVADAFGKSEENDPNTVPIYTDGKVHLRKKIYDKDDLIITLCLNGILIRTFKYKNKVLCSVSVSSSGKE